MSDSTLNKFFNILQVYTVVPVVITYSIRQSVTFFIVRLSVCLCVTGICKFGP